MVINLSSAKVITVNKTPIRMGTINPPLYIIPRMFPGFGCPSASKLFGLPRIMVYTNIPIPMQMAMANEAMANEKPPDVFFLLIVLEF
jgi:hypothetical protein